MPMSERKAIIVGMERYRKLKLQKLLSLPNNKVSLKLLTLSLIPNTTVMEKKSTG
uniref:hypothetical protein n=1 Tax=Salmonella sp. TaxID=599 RepID=UPI001CD9AE18|nr:hypothetical protein [Salmonella sp.]